MELALNIGSLQYSRSLHSERLSAEQRLHEEELKAVKETFAVELCLEKQTHLINAFTDIERYFQELNEDLIRSSKDAERDMADQRIQQFQTLLISGTIMLLSLFCLVIEGSLPAEAKGYDFYDSLVILFSLMNMTSLSFLLISIILCVEIMTRVQKFMKTRSKVDMNLMYQAMNHSRMVFADLGALGQNPRRRLSHFTQTREDSTTMSPIDSSFSRSGDTRSHISEKSETSNPFISRNSGTQIQNSNGPNSTGSRFGLERRNSIARMPSHSVEKQFLEHEKNVHKYLEGRGKINDAIDSLSFSFKSKGVPRNKNKHSAACGNVSFMIYWRTHCAFHGKVAIALFYMGTSCSLISIMTYMWSIFRYRYKTMHAGVGAVATIVLTLMMCWFIIIYLRLNASASSFNGDDDDDLEEEHDHDDDDEEEEEEKEEEEFGEEKKEEEKHDFIGRPLSGMTTKTADYKGIRMANLYTEFVPSMFRSPVRTETETPEHGVLDPISYDSESLGYNVQRYSLRNETDKIDSMDIRH